VAKNRDSRSDAVRSAVDQAFQATGGGASQARDRAQDLVDELAQAAGRVREALDDLRPASSDEIRGLRADLRALEKRVAALEKAPKAKGKAKPKPRRSSGAS
jgi:polyhydroxyalkanoate synthesis regulator phasin